MFDADADEVRSGCTGDEDGGRGDRDEDYDDVEGREVGGDGGVEGCYGFGEEGLVGWCEAGRW